MSASPDSSPGNPRPFSFGDLGRPRPSTAATARLLPPIKDADASSELELDMDDILESNDIETFEVAASAVSTEMAAPAPEPAPERSSGFEVGDLGAFDDIEVEGAAADVTPVSLRVDYKSPQPSTLIGMPAAPITSPLPLEESVIVADAPAPAPERTQEMKGDVVAQVAEAAAFLDGDMPERTQVLVRAHMPASIQGPRTLPTGHTPPPTSVHTPSSALAATAPAWANGRHPASGQGPVAHANIRPSSIAPVAVDVSRARPTMPSVPAVAAPPAAARPAKSGTSGLLIGGLCFAAAALIGVVGVGGYLASRTLSDKPDSLAIAPAPQAAAEPAPVAAAAAAADPVAAPADPVAKPADPAAAAPSAAGVDVSSLPAAPAKGAAAPVAAAPAAAAPAPAPRSIAGSTGGSRPTGGSSPAAPTGRSGAPLPPPGAANASAPPPPAATGGAVALPPPPPKAAPVAAPPAAVASTGNVNVDPKLRAVVVDGSFRRVNDGVLTLSCGTHRIKVGMNDPQVVNVPCGGSVSL